MYTNISGQEIILEWKLSQISILILTMIFTTRRCQRIRCDENTYTTGQEYFLNQRRVR